jgi:hypothetical protein
VASDRPRCSSVSLGLEEPQFATASNVRGWVFLEQPGPWGPDALLQSRLPAWFAGQVHRRTRDLGLRVILIRRPGGASANDRHVFFARTGPDHVWMEHARLLSVEDLLDADLAALAGGNPPGLGVIDVNPLYLVCTNGRRDPCCAERGRPLVRALQPAFPDRIWECSHIGGDRFAGNLVCFPHGVYFGRVGPDEAVRVALGYREGALDLDHYRGRAGYGFATQAAEHFVRLRLDLRGVDDLRLLRRTRTSPGELLAEFAGPGDATIRVRLAVRRDPRARWLTCKSRSPESPPSYEVIELV